MASGVWAAAAVGVARAVGWRRGGWAAAASWPLRGPSWGAGAAAGQRLAVARRLWWWRADRQWEMVVERDAVMTCLLVTAEAKRGR